MKKSIKLIASIMLISLGTYAQSIGPSTINASGGSGTIGTDHFAYSIGEMAMITTNTASGMTITHGLLQPNQVAPDAVVYQFSQDQVQIYPNPTIDEINIQTFLHQSGELSVNLFDVTGKYIQAAKFDITEQTQVQQMNIQQMSAGSYFLNVLFTPLHGDPQKHVFTLIKN